MAGGVQVINTLGYEVCWHEEVYRPAEDTLLLMRALDNLGLRKGGLGRVLDLGTGTGVLALHALVRGAREVVATDVNPRAVEAAYCTLARGARRVSPRLWSVGRCDLTTCLRLGGGVFDVVVFNPPYLPSDGRRGSWLDRAWDGGPTGTEVLTRLIDILGNDGFTGVLLFVVSSLSGSALEKVYEKIAYHRVVGSLSFFFERIYAVEARLVG